MNRNNRTFLITFFLAAFVTASAASTAFAQDRERRVQHSFDVGESGVFTLANISGDITVTGGPGTVIELEAIKRLEGDASSALLDSVVIDVSHTGDRVRVETQYRDQHREGEHRQHQGGVSVEYRVTVPRGTEVELVSVSGDVAISGVEGESRVQSVSGDVRADSCPAATEVKSVSGDVHVSGVRSGDSLEVSSVSGTVTVEDVEAEELDISSVSGNVVANDVVCDEAELDSTSGDIRYTGAIRPSGRYEFRSHSGNVVIALDGSVGFELEARTHSGRIESELEMRVTENGRQERRLNALIGDGSAVIEARTFSGNVTIKRR